MSLAVCILIMAIYSGLFAWMAYGFLRTPVFKTTNTVDQPVTVIICARNEAQLVAACLNSLITQSYDPGRLQVIFINDASTDQTLAIAENVLSRSAVDYRIISNTSQKGKKESISSAMEIAKHELIVLRDADTITPSSTWLKTISAYQQETSADLIIGPIALADNSGLLWALQAVETNVLTVITGGSTHHAAPFLCSGANLAFTRSIFRAVNGYSSHLRHSSGDDIFFLEDVKRLPAAKIVYLKSPEAIVRTYATTSFGALLRQRTRWAAKVRYNTNWLNRVTAVITVLANCAWLFAFVSVLVNPLSDNAVRLLVLYKLGFDILLLFLASGFIKNKRLLAYALPVALVYPTYSLLVSVATVTIKPKWKR